MSASVTEDDVSSHRDHVTALARGLEVIRAFDGAVAQMTLADVAKACGLSRATARRSLLTLRDTGYVLQSGRLFSLSPQVLTLAQCYLRSSTLPRVAQLFLERISETTAESCSASVLHGQEVIYVARSSRRRPASQHRHVGTHLPAYCTSMGRVLVAALPAAERDAYLEALQIRAFTPHTVATKIYLRNMLDQVTREGYCIVDQELEIGLRSLAVPVRDGSGRVVAALNISTDATTTPREDLVRLHLPRLQEAAADMRPLLIG